jgi:hypothetical protein
VAVRADHRPNPSYDDPTFRMTFARLVTHYWRHAAFLEDGILLAEVGRLGGIPGVLVHGRLDVSSPLDIAWELARAWPDAELVVVDEAGHSAADPDMTEAVVAATDRFARRRDRGHGPACRFAMPTSGSAAGYDARRLLGVGSFLRGAALSASGTGEPIAHGRDAEVYALGDGRVLRRYRRPGPTDHELRVMAHARSCGFPVPRSMNGPRPTWSWTIWMAQPCLPI